MTFFTFRNSEIEKTIQQTISSHAIDGVIFLYKPENPWIISNVESSVPCIAVCDRDSIIKFDSIELNSNKIGSILAQHLIDLGHERIAFVATELSDKHSLRVKRLEGVRKTYQLNGFEPDDSVIACTFESEGIVLHNDITDYEAGFKLTNSIIGKYDVTALIGNNDMVAFGIIDALQRMKKRIPQDYSVCGCDNTKLANIKSLSLTTVDNYTALRAAEAVDVLVRKIQNVHNAKGSESPVITFKIEYTPRLVSRASTGPVRRV